MRKRAPSRHPRGGNGGAPPTLLLYAEQGLGDTVQMLRYVGMVQDRGWAVDLMVPDALKRLVRHNYASPSVRVLDAVPEPGAYRWHAPLLSLPGIMGTTVETIPWPAPFGLGYLTPLGTHRAGAVLGAAWGAEPRARPVVGLCTYGNKDHMNDHDRSMPLAWREHLTRTVTSVDWVVLDRGECAWELTDLADTADLIACCDAVVSVDTATAHLSGALGVPTLLLPPSSPEWRWGLPEPGGVTSTPWYPGVMACYWRHRSDDWGGVLDRVGSAIEARTWPGVPNPRILTNV